MRRTGIALLALATLVIALGASGSGALAISPSTPLSALPDPVSFNAQLIGLATPPQTVTFTNLGSSAVDINNNGVTTDNNDYNVVNDQCSNATLNQNDSCTVGVTFTPMSSGPDPGNLSIADDDPTNSSQQVAMGGQGVTDQFSLSGPIDFGDQRVGVASGDQAEIVTNNTDYPANPNGPSISGAGAGDFNLDGNDCSGQVATTCTINVNFQPTGLGPTSATLNAAGQSVSLTGNGVAPNASVSPGSIPFGSQPVATTSGPSTITLTNNGTGPLNYGTVTEGGPNQNDFQVGDADCKAIGSIAPGNSCAITVTFLPTTTGSRSATVIVHDDDPTNPTQTVTVSGNGTPSSVGFAPSSVTFVTPIPAGTASPVHSVTVSNTTNSTLPITGISIVGTNPKNFIHSADTCTGKTLGPNGTCTIRVEFTPSAAGQRTALLQVRDSGPITPHSHQVSLTGTGLFPHDPKSVRGTVGCGSSHITWVSPTATRFAGTRVVRNHAHFPTNPGDGTIVPRAAAGIAVDKGLKHFTTYFYRVFARYHSLTHAGGLNYSAGVHLKEHTGEICTPQNGARLRDLTPKFTWLAHPTRSGYAFVLERSGDTIWINYTKKTSWQMPSSWRYKRVGHRLVRGGSYTFFLFAYPASHPDGILIGQVSFTEL
jgi:hypothetical protein